MKYTITLRKRSTFRNGFIKIVFVIVSFRLFSPRIIIKRRIKKETGSIGEDRTE